jgi:hypothetical protein
MGQAYCSVPSMERFQTVPYEELCAKPLRRRQGILTGLKKILFHGPAKSFF